MTALIARAAVVLVLAVGGVALTMPPSAGNTPGCVTRHEYNKVHQFQLKATVHDIFDTDARRVARHNIGFGEGRDVVRSYPKCAGFDGGRGRVGVLFFNYAAALDGCSGNCSGMRFYEAVRWNPSSLIWW